MVLSPSARRRLRASRSRTTTVLCCCVLCCIVVLMVSCGGSAPVAGPGTPATSSEPTAPSVSEDRVGPFASDVIAIWAEGMQKLVVLIQEKPQPATVTSAVESLKQEYAQKLVGYGRKRLAFTGAEKEQVDSLLFMGMTALSNEPWYQSYMSLYEHYSTGDLDFANLLASFNVLTQYADFDLLKQQSPEEAARLGIE